MPGLGTTSALAPVAKNTNSAVNGFVWAYKQPEATPLIAYVPNGTDSTNAETAASYIASKEGITVGIVGNTTVYYNQQTNYSNYTTANMAAQGWSPADASFYGSSSIVAPNGQLYSSPDSASGTSNSVWYVSSSSGKNYAAKVQNSTTNLSANCLQTSTSNSQYTSDSVFHSNGGGSEGTGSTSNASNQVDATQTAT